MRVLCALGVFVAVKVGVAVSWAHSPDASDSNAPIVIGDVFPYSRVPAHAASYKKGSLLALDEINAQRDADQPPFVLYSLDSKGDPNAVTRLVDRLIYKEGADMITGTYFSHVALAVAEHAKRRQFVFLAAEPLADSLTLKHGNAYTFRLRPSTLMQVKMLAQYALSSQSQVAGDFVTIAPDYAYGQDAVAAFRDVFQQQPGVKFVSEQWPALNQIDAAAEVAALLRYQPDVIFNVTFGADLGKFVRELSRSQLPQKPIQIYSLLTGEPEYLLPLGAEAPEGWIVTGYPVAQDNREPHRAFREAYLQRYQELPMLGGLVGYMTVKSAAAALERAADHSAEALRAAFADLSVDTPVGTIVFRASDHQSTMGTWVGQLARTPEGVKMMQWVYQSGEAFMASPERVKRERQSEAQSDAQSGL